MTLRRNLLYLIVPAWMLVAGCQVKGDDRPLFEILPADRDDEPVGDRPN